MARLIVAVETRTPAASAYQAQCSANVASGAASSRGGSAAASGPTFTGGAPRRGLGASPPVCRRSRRYRFTVAGETPKVRAASPRGIPPSTAATTRDRRSSE